jgi:ParB family chromosome partitioning protein
MTEMESVKNIQARICPQIREIPLCDIHIKANIRREYPDIDELAVSIRQHGLLQPIIVYDVSGEGYFVKTGHRRYMAYQKLYAEEPERFNTILCMVSDAHNIPVIQTIENLQRRDLSAIELFHALSSLREQGLTLKQIADVTGKSEKSIKNIFVGINEIETNTSLKKFLDSPAGGTIDDIVETKGIADEAARIDLLNQRASGQISRAELRRKTSGLKQTKEGAADTRRELFAYIFSNEIRIRQSDGYKDCGTSFKWKNIEQTILRYLQSADCPYKITVKGKHEK